MNLSQLPNTFLDQSKDLHWMVDLNFKLVYANKKYFNFMEKATKAGKKLNESAFIEGFGKEDVEQWKTHYQRAFEGERFEVEEHFYNKASKEIEYSQVVFEPLVGEDGKVFSVACTSKEITREAQKKMEAYQMVGASLDVFCAIDEDGDFVSLNGAVLEHWGYAPEELLGRPFMDLVVEEDVAKTEKIADSIINGKLVKSFENRYNRKDGSIAYNSWSTRWDESAKLMYGIARDAKEKIEKEEIIRQSEQRFRALVQEGSDLISIIDEHGNYRYSSPNLKSILGFDADELQGKNAFDFIHPEDIDRTKKSLERIETENSVKIEPFRFKNQAGEWRWIETVLTNMVHNPAVNGVVTNSRDITEKIEQEEKIIRSEKRFKALVQEGNDIYAIVDREGAYTYMSPSITRASGIPPEKFIGINAFDFIHPDDLDQVLASFNKIQVEGRVEMDVYRAKNHKNEWRWVETVLTNMLDNPAVNGIVINSRDITDEVNEKHRLKLFEKVINSTSDAIIITEAEPLDKPGPRIEYVNEAFTKNTGYTAAEVIGKNPRFLQGPNTNQEELKLLGEKLRMGESAEITVQNYTKSGEEFWVNFIVNPITDQSGSISHYISVQRNVTSQKKKEQERELLAQISQVFNSNDDYIDATKDLCKTISEFGKLDWVELWMVNLEKSHLLLMSHHLIEPSDELFYNGKTSFEYNQGLPGKVWESKKQLYWNDIDEKEDFIRSKAAKKVGFKAALGVPLIYKDEVIGVLLVGSKKKPEQLNKLAWLFKRLQKPVGFELSRKQIEVDLNQIFNFTPDLICVSGFDGYIKRINPAGIKILGYSLEELLSRPIKSFVHEEDQSQTERNQHNLYKGENLDNFENRYITKEGKVVWLSWTATSIPAQGVVYAVAKDVTVEKKLRLLNEQTRELAKVGSWEYDVIEDNLFWSDEVHLLHETDPNAFVPNIDTAIDFYKEEHKSYVAELIHKSITEGVYLDYEAVIISTSKKERWVRVIGNPEFIEGKCVKFIGCFQDFTYRKEVETRLRTLSDNIPGVVYQYLLHPDGRDEFTYVSKGSEKIWGYSSEEVIENIDLVWDQTKAGGQFEAVKQSIKNSVENKSQWSIRYRTITPEGEDRILQGLGTPEFLTNGTVLFNSVVLDVTQKAKNQELLDDVIKLTKIGSWEVNLMNNTIFWSDEVHKIYETAPNKFVPSIDSAINFYREDYRHLALSSFEQCMITGEPYDIEAVIVTANKKEIWVRTTAKAEIVDGVCTRVYGSFQNIQERKEAEVRLQSLADNLPGVIYQYIIHPDGTDSIQLISGMVEQLWGYTINEVSENIDLLWDQIKLGGDIEEVRTSIQNAIENKSKWTSRFKIVKPTGELKTHFGSGTPVFLADGTILFNVIILDVTQEAQNEELLKQTAQIARVGSWEMNLINPEGDSMFWSPMLMEIVEVDDTYKPTLTGGIEFHVGESQDRIKRALDQLITKGVAFDEEILLRTAKGNERWCRAIGKSEMLNNQRTKIYGSYQDIHERKLATLELEKSLKSLADYKFALDQSAIIAFTDSKGVITSVNDNFCKISEYNRKEIIGNTHRLINAKHHPKAFFIDLWRTIGSGKVWRGEIKNKTKTGSYYWVDTTIMPFLDEKNKPTQYLAIRFDITERKKIEESLKSTSERLRIATSSGNIGIWDWDVVNDDLIWDETMYRIFGVEESECTGAYEAWEATLHPDDLDETKAKVQSALEGLSKFKTEFRIVLKDKSIRYLTGEAIVISEDNTGKPTRVIGTNIDITERRVAEIEKNSLQQTLENSLNEIYTFDVVSFQFSYANKGALANLGYSEKEILELTPLNIKPDYTATSFKELVEPLISKEKQKIVFFTNHRRKDGRIYPTEIHLQLIEGSLTKQFLAIVLDITERKQADEKILQANERFEKVTEATNDAIWDWDIAENTLYRSKAIESFFGKGTTLALSKKDFWTDRFHAEDVDQVDKSVQEAIADPTCFRWESEYRLYNTDDELIYVIDRGVIVRNEHGKAIRMVGSMTNITELKESERDNKFKANLLGTIGQAAIATNLDGIVSYWNHAAENIYGWAQEEALGKNIMQLTTPGTSKKQAKQIMEMLKQGQSWFGEFNVTNKYGRNFPAYISNSPIFDENNKLSGIIGISSDITEEVKSKRLIEQYTKELERSNQELEQFAFIASHDLQEPLRMVTSFMDLLKRRYADELDEKAHQYIHFATDGASRMKQIILDLLEYSRSTRPDENTIEVDFNELVSDFKQLRRNLMEEKQATLTFKNLPTLVTYRAVVTQIIHCLLDNALKYTKKGIPVQVNVRAVDNKNEWEFSVKDNGIGVESQFHSKIFDIFQRLHNKEEYAGTGIGLSLAKRHVEFLGGEIWLKSELGKGTVFYFTIPKTK